MRTVIVMLLTLALVVTSVAGCGGIVSSAPADSASSQAVESAAGTEPGPDSAPSAGVTAVPAQYATGPVVQAKVEAPDASEATEIALGQPITVSGPGVSVSDNTVTIGAAGVYRISGTLEDGQVLVDTQDNSAVTLIIDGVDITCTTSAPIYIVRAEEALIYLADGSSNRVTDGEAYSLQDRDSGEPNAAVFSKADLTSSGSGSLTVNASFEHGIHSKDLLTIYGGTLVVDAVGDGIRGRDGIIIAGGDLTVTAGGDALRSSNDQDPDRGYVAIDGGTVRLTAGDDGIDAETRITIRDGQVSVLAGGGSVSAVTRAQVGPFQPWGGNVVVDEGPRSKGMVAGIDLTIEGGTVMVDALDDALHSNDSLAISGGAVTLASGDDAIRAESTVLISGGQVRITRSYEGIEASAITITGGVIHVVASDDGINATGAGDSPWPAGPMGRPGMGGGGNNRLDIRGGYVVVDALGDGIDINGSVTMSGGTLIVHGPMVNNEGALDYDGTFAMTGGYLVAAGSAGMAQAPDSSSTQNSVMINLPSALPAGALFHIAAADGQEVLTFAPQREYQFVVVNTADLASGADYAVYTGGSATGTSTDGLYAGGAYTPCTQVGTFSVSGAVTVVGSAGGMMRGGRR